MALLFMTTFQAIDQRDGELKVWRGPNIEAIGFTDATFIRDNSKRFYLEIMGVIQDDNGDHTEKKKLLN